MDDDLEILKKLLAPLDPIMYYFHYDPVTGLIVNLRNYLEVDEYPYLKFPFTDFESNISSNDYQILNINGNTQLVKRNKSIDHISKIDDKIYQIPKKNADPDIKISQINYQFDVLVEQDNVKKEFRIRLSGELKDQYHQDLNSKKSIILYITAENDPNILYKTLDIPLNKLLQYHSYTIPYNEFEDVSCNIFSIKYFNNYLHLVIE